MPSRADRRRALAAAAPWLRCPVCASPLHLAGARLSCDRHHDFDIARQGYVSLTTARARTSRGDSAAMVAARGEFLRRGHYQPVAAALQSVAARTDPGLDGLVADLAGGPGYYLAAVLEALPGRAGVCLDLSVPALRRAARSHPRAAAVGADVWQPLPLADRSAALALSVFGPRNAAETGRILAPGGLLIIAGPGGGHLRELQRPLGLLGTDRRRSQRLARAYRDYLPEAVSVHYELSLDHADVTALVAMGPSARHITPQALAARVGCLPSPVTVTVDLQITVLARPGPGAAGHLRRVR